MYIFIRQAERLRVKAIRATEKAAQEAKSLGLKQYNAQKKEGEPCRYNIIIFIKYLFSIGGSSCTTGAIFRGIIRYRRVRDYNSKYDPWGRPCAVGCHLRRHHGMQALCWRLVLPSESEWHPAKYYIGARGASSSCRGRCV